MNKTMYINRNETKALGMAADQIRTILEACSADEDPDVVKDLNFMIKHLDNLQRKGLKKLEDKEVFNR